MALRIRRLGPGDEELLARIAGEADDFDLPGASEPEEPLPADEAGAYLRDPAVVHWVAEEDGVLVGEALCHVLRLPSGPRRELLLYAIGVRSAKRRQGIGTALVEEMLAWAAAASIQDVWVLADNPAAAAFYEARGFIRGEKGSDPVYYQRRVTARA